MKKTMSVLLLSIGLLFTACSTRQVERSMTTYVKDLVQPDVFSVLPQSGQEMLVYQNSAEIEGEYFELASVEIQKISDEDSSERMIEKLVEETKGLGGNGVLLIEKTSSKDGNLITQQMKAIAVFTLDRMPYTEPIVSL